MEVLCVWAHVCSYFRRGISVHRLPWAAGEDSAMAGSDRYAALYHRRTTRVLVTLQGAPHCKQWLQALHVKQVECDSFIVQS